MRESAIHALAPPFVKLRDGCEPTGDVENWDAWSVEDVRTGEQEKDYLKGTEYCDIALKEVNRTESPGALTLTLSTIFTKIKNGEIQPGPLEKGFLDCLARRAAERRAQLDAD